MGDTNRNRLQLQIPQFIYNTEPTLVPGGGAEVIPLSNPAWFTNNGFTNSFSHFQTSSTETPQVVEDYTHQQELSTSAPFDFQLPSQEDPPFETSSSTIIPQPPVNNPDFTPFLAKPPSHQNPQGAPAVPVYSATGFDLLSVLARVATRPNPKVFLGPVDLTCSFVVADVRRFDHPIVYCSPNFLTLTGYSEDEVIGRNCRFLQAPDGNVRKGDIRTHTSHEAVSHLKRSLLADKECQTSIVNYKKDGTAFINLVTVIPLPGGISNTPGEENDYAYQVGFQVDLTEQPNAILEKLKHGSYLVNYSSPADLAARQSSQSSRERKSSAIPQATMSKELKELIADQSFLDSIPLSTSTAIHPPVPATANSNPQDESTSGGGNQLLHLLLLESSPDFVHVVSLKGSFLYVAPSVRRVLGYEPDEMVSGSLADYAHPEDVIPLMRELKESSATGGPGLESNAGSTSAGIVPRAVNLLFRAKTKMGRYVWVECRGRLHVEPGKGRKAIVLTGRAREMANLKWEDVKSAGGLTKGARVTVPSQEKGKEGWRLVEQEIWGLLAGDGKDTMAFSSIGKGVEDVLGWRLDDLLGKSVVDIVVDESVKNVLGGIVHDMRRYQHSLQHTSRSPSTDSGRVKKVRCSLRKKDSSIADVWFVIYRTEPNDDDEPTNPTNDRTTDESKGAALSISPAPLVYQIRLVDADTMLPGSTCALPQLPLPTSSLANAVPSYMLHSTSIPSTSSSMPTEDETSSTPVEVFEELSTSRGSSWQYELQQLRFANVRLREELAALDLTGGSPAGRLESTSSSLVRTPPEQDSASYDYGSSLHDQVRPSYEGHHHIPPSSEERAPFLPAQPSIPAAQSHISQPGQLQHVAQPHNIPLNRPQQSQPPAHRPDWGTSGAMPVATTMTISRTNTTSLKRPWGSSH